MLTKKVIKYTEAFSNVHSNISHFVKQGKIILSKIEKGKIKASGFFKFV